MTAPSSRVSVHVLLAAAVALAACGPGPHPQQCKGVDQACAVGTECCSGDCSAGACACSAVAEPCGTSADCCDSVSPSRCDGGTCVSGQRPFGDVCDWDGQCASLNCDLTGHCAAVCLSWNAPCSSSSQCCSFLGCASGTCTLQCGNDHDACANDNDCCSDYRCRAGECQHGICGTAGQSCHSEADCCTAAQGGKEYFCNEYGTCEIGRPYDMPGTPPEPCSTDANCADGSVCRGGFCHWPDGHQPDGHWCLDGQECAGGHCTSTASGVPGTCCSGAGAACSADRSGIDTICCAGLELACTGAPGAQRCDACLDFTNSGPQGTAETQCTTDSQCCVDRNLGCVAGECCTRRGNACTAGTGDTECCAGDTCGAVTDYHGTQSNVCCGDFGASCGPYEPCCDGLLCGNDGTCHLGPGEACTESAQCADRSGCKIETPPTGACCGHDMAGCVTDADCCSGDCDESFGSCRLAQEYGLCLDDSDCSSWVPGQWDGPVCGGNPHVGQLHCCPVPGDTCVLATDCCEAGDSCKVPYDGSSTSARCCRETPAACSDNAQCCTGTCWSHYVNGSPAGTCCAYPGLKTFTCASDADCCDSATYSGVQARVQCGDTNLVMRCCLKKGQPSGNDPSTCCTGRVGQLGDCQ